MIRSDYNSVSPCAVDLETLCSDIFKINGVEKTDDAAFPLFVVQMCEPKTMKTTSLYYHFVPSIKCHLTSIDH